MSNVKSGNMTGICSNSPEAISRLTEIAGTMPTRETESLTMDLIASIEHEISEVLAIRSGVKNWLYPSQTANLLVTGIPAIVENGLEVSSLSSSTPQPSLLTCFL